MTTVDFLKIQQESGFYLHCVICQQFVSPERLVRGADTCSNECQKQRRAAYNRFMKQVRLQRVLRSPKVRRLAVAMEAQKTQGSSAPAVSQVMA